MSKQKVIFVDEETHEIAKKKADEKGMTLKGYIKQLVKKDK